MHSSGSKSIASLFSKDKITILVTDSGLGGLSIFAQIAARIKTEPIFSRVSLIYYNAWPEQNRGYNALKDMEERVRVFDRALEGMKRYRPDVLLIACNTLSVLYNRTAFSRRENIPVVDIVRFGVAMVYESLFRETDTKAVLMGTLTTIASDVHRSKLIQKGISENRLIPQPCDQLATEIEKGPESDTVARMVDVFATEAAEKLEATRSQIFIALFCTHFGYCRDLIRKKFQDRVQGRVTVLDPNERMAEFLFEACGGVCHKRSVVELQVVSRIVWDPIRIDAISKIVEKRSPEAALALKNYGRIPDLFTF